MGLIIDAWHQIRCRHEWRAVEAQVNAWGQERRRGTKHSNRRKAKKDCNATAQTSPSLSFAVRELQSRTKLYRDTASNVAGLVGADVLHIGQLQAGQQLELSDACLDHLVVNIRAPRGHCRA